MIKLQTTTYLLSLLKTLHLTSLSLSLSSARTRQSLARVISAVAELLLPISQWPELTTHLYQWSTSSNSQHREIGVFVLYTVFDSVVDAMQDQLDAMLEQLFGLFSKTINDPESYNVRVVTLQ